MVLGHEARHPSRWAKSPIRMVKSTILISAKITPALTRIVCLRFSDASSITAAAFSDELSRSIAKRAQRAQKVAHFRQRHVEMMLL
jgi:hypothetical protein